jgi:hypothetical protein
MNDDHLRSYEMIRRVDGFHADNAASFPAGTLGDTIFGRIHARVTAIGNFIADQTAGAGDFHAATMSKATRHEDLTRMLERLRRTVRSMSHAPGNEHLKAKFRIPRSPAHQGLLAAARSSASDAQELQTQLAAYGLPPDFADQLNAKITAFEASLTDQNSGREDQVEATAGIENEIAEALKDVREVDGIVRNVFFDQPAKLAAWESARHIESRPHRKKANPPNEPAK